MKEKFIERRRYPRIKKRLPLKLYADNYEISTQTHNLSCIGAYCTLNRNIPVLTKLSVMLILPDASKKEGMKVFCKGVVVRNEKDSSGRFNIAIFFNDITEQEKRKLSHYIDKHLLKY